VQVTEQSIERVQIGVRVQLCIVRVVYLAQRSQPDLIALSEVRADDGDRCSVFEPPRLMRGRSLASVVIPKPEELSF
jgi:hypothetical protein